MSTSTYEIVNSGRGESTSPTILLVEDYDGARFMLRIALEMQGYRVVEATDGVQAISVAKEEKPDLVLMDLNLPLLDGFGATRRIRELIGFRDVPIIAVTAYGTSEYRSKAMAAGCDEFITKPINLSLLKNILSCIVPVSRSYATAGAS